MNCESLLDHAAGFLDGSLTGSDRESMTRHLEACADCRALVAALAIADDPGLADAVLARTSGAACNSARSQLCDRIDGELGLLDAELVDGHLHHCSECRAMAVALRRLQEDLPRLAAVDPGPGFVEAVLARTSRRPRRVPLAARWAAAVSRLLERPRIALEGAFVAAAVVGLPLAASPEPIAMAPSYVITEARGAVCELEAAVQIRTRSAWATTQAFVREGTFVRLGASRQQENKR